MQHILEFNNLPLNHRLRFFVENKVINFKESKIDFKLIVEKSNEIVFSSSTFDYVIQSKQNNYSVFDFTIDFIAEKIYFIFTSDESIIKDIKGIKAPN